MVTQAVDSNISALIQDLFALQNRVRTANNDALQDLINAYLLLNRPIIERGLEAWAAAPEEELKAMLPEHRELDGSATTHSFSSIATDALRHAQQALATSTGRDLLQVTDDNLHMLDRMLEFAKYLARTDDLELQWSPVSRMLDNPTRRRSSSAYALSLRRRPTSPPHRSRSSPSPRRTPSRTPSASRLTAVPSAARRPRSRGTTGPSRTTSATTSTPTRSLRSSSTRTRGRR
ncbi:MAG: hypothetical protein ACXVVQ_13340 [Solirubrobacteraceae bacterium]